MGSRKWEVTSAHQAPPSPASACSTPLTQRSLSLPQARASSHRQERTSSPAQFSPSTCGMLDRALEVSDTVNAQQGLLDECMLMSRCARAGGSGRGRDRSGAARRGGGWGREVDTHRTRADVMGAAGVAQRNLLEEGRLGPSLESLCQGGAGGDPGRASGGASVLGGGGARLSSTMAGGPEGLAAVKAPTGAVPRGHCVCRVPSGSISPPGCVGLQSENEP